MVLWCHVFKFLSQFEFIFVYGVYFKYDMMVFCNFIKLHAFEAVQFSQHY